MFEIRQANARGKADFGWLQSRHTFSFGRYYDPAQMGFSALRVINDDVVAPGTGFDTHGHRDMEIITYVLEGAIEHKDSAGNSKILPAGEFQVMSAGKGILHSEYNASQQKMLHFLQIWIEPDQTGGSPGYQQKSFGQQHGLTLIASPDGRDNSFVIKQQAFLYQLLLKDGEQQHYQPESGRNVYLHLIKGNLQLAGQQLKAGDGIKLVAPSELDFVAKQDVQALLFDLP